MQLKINFSSWWILSIQYKGIIKGLQNQMLLVI